MLLGGTARSSCQARHRAITSALVRPSVAEMVASSAFVLASGQLQLVDDDDRRALGLGRQSMLEAKRTNLLGQVMRHGCERPGRGPCRRRGTAERVPSAVTGAARTLLLVHLRAGARDFGAALGLVRALLASWQAASARRAAGCPRADRGRKSPSESSTSPASSPLERCDLRSMILSLSGRSLAFGAARADRAQASAALRRQLRSLDAHRGRRIQPPLRTGNRTADQDQAALGVGRRRSRDSAW